MSTSNLRGRNINEKCREIASQRQQSMSCLPSWRRANGKAARKNLQHSSDMSSQVKLDVSGGRRLTANASFLEQFPDREQLRPLNDGKSSVAC
jgi:hypothetical protein